MYKALVGCDCYIVYSGTVYPAYIKGTRVDDKGENFVSVGYSVSEPPSITEFSVKRDIGQTLFFDFRTAEIVALGA